MMRSSGGELLEGKPADKLCGALVVLGMSSDLPVAALINVSATSFNSRNERLFNAVNRVQRPGASSVVSSQLTAKMR